jgi:putative transposase
MQTCESLKHTTWDGKYHVVFIPKYRRMALYQGLRQELGTGFRSLAEQWNVGWKRAICCPTMCTCC